MANKVSKTLELVIRLNDAVSDRLKKIGEGFKKTNVQIKSDTTTSMMAVNKAYQKLDIKPLSKIEQEIKGIERSYKLLKKSGTLTMKELSRASVQAKMKISALKAESSGLGTAFGAAKMQIAGLIASTYLSTRAVTGLVTAYAKFETTMLTVKAVSDSTEKQYKELTELSLTLGRTTRFTANEAAEGMRYLAMSGFDVKETMSALPGVLSLAAAGNLQLGQSADIATNILLGFGMEVEQLGRVNDVMVKTFTNTNSTLIELGEGFKYVGPIAKGVGVDFEELVGTLGLLHNAGIKGSMAGTSLRGAISRLMSPTNQEAELMQSLGEKIGVTSLQVRNSEGDFIGFANVIKQLEDAGVRGDQALALFGLRAGPAMAALISQGSESLRELNGELKEAEGTADRVAKEMTSGMGGAILKTKSALEGLSLAMGGAIATPATLFLKIITNIALGLRDMTIAGKTLITVLLALGVAMGAKALMASKFALSMKALTTATYSAATATKTLGMVTKTAGLIGLVVIATEVAIALAKWANSSDIFKRNVEVYASTAVIWWKKIHVSILKAYNLADKFFGNDKAVTLTEKKISAIENEIKVHEELRQTILDELATDAENKAKQKAKQKADEAERARQAKEATRADAHYEKIYKSFEKQENKKIQLIKRQSMSGQGVTSQQANEAIRITAQKNNTLLVLAQEHADRVGKIYGYEDDAYKSAQERVKEIAEESKAELAQIYEDSISGREDSYKKEVDAIRLAGELKIKSAEETELALFSITQDKIADSIKLQTEYANKTKDLFGANDSAYLDALNKQKASIAELESLRGEALQNYSKALDSVRSKEKEWASVSTSIERDLANARREGMSAREAQADITREISEKIGELGSIERKQDESSRARKKELINELRTLYSDQAKRVKDEEGEIIQTREEGLKKQKAGLEELQAIVDDIAKREIRHSKDTAQEWKNKYNELDGLIEKTFRERTAIIKFSPTIDNMKREMDDLMKEEVKKVKVEILKEVKTVEKKATGGIAGSFARRSGHLPGWGSIDDVPSLLQRGEFIIKKDAVKKYGVGFFNMLNRMRFPQVVPKFAEGGFVEDAGILAKIQKLQEKIALYQEKIEGVASYSDNIESNLNSAMPDFSGLADISKAKTPEEAIDILEKIGNGLQDTKTKMVTSYNSLMTNALENGNTEVSGLLKDERDEVKGLADELSDEFKSILESLKQTTDELREKERLAIEEYNEKIEEQKAIQQMIKDNISHIQNHNESNVDNNFTMSALQGKFKGDASGDLFTRKLTGTDGTQSVTVKVDIADAEAKKAGLHKYQDQTRNFYNPNFETPANIAHEKAESEKDSITKKHNLEIKAIGKEMKDAMSDSKSDGSSLRKEYRSNIGVVGADMAIRASVTKEGLTESLLQFEEEKYDFEQELIELKRKWEEEQRKKWAPRYAKGGSVFKRRRNKVHGVGDEDTVPAMLMPGEYIVKKSAVQKYGEGFFNAVNNATFPVNLIPRFKDGGIVFPQHFASGGPVSPTDPYIPDARILQKIENIVKLIDTLSLKSEGIKEHSGDIDKIFAGVENTTNVATGIAKAKTPEEALEKMYGFQKNYRGKKRIINDTFNKLIVEASTNGNPELARLLQSERSDTTDIANEIDELLVSLIETFKEQIDEIKAKQEEIQQQFEEEYAEQLRIQEAIKSNMELVKAHNDSNYSNEFNEEFVNEFFRTKGGDYTDGLKGQIGTTGMQEISKKKSYSWKPGKHYYTSSTASKIDIYDENGRFVREQSFPFMTGKVSYEGLPTEVKGSFYDPKILTQGSSLEVKVKEETDRLKKENKKMMEQIRLEKIDVIKSSAGGFRESLKTHTGETEIAEANAVLNATVARQELGEKIEQAEYDKVDLETQLAEEKEEWLRQIEELKLKIAKEKAEALAKKQGLSGGDSTIGGSTRTFFATGGPVIGQEGVDKIPAMLSNGEYVIKKSIVGKLGKTFFDKLNNDFSLPDLIMNNSIVPRFFKDGGIVDTGKINDTGKIEGLGTLNLSVGGKSFAMSSEISNVKQLIRELKKAGATIS